MKLDRHRIRTLWVLAFLFVIALACIPGEPVEDPPIFSDDVGIGDDVNGGDGDDDANVNSEDPTIDPSLVLAHFDADQGYEDGVWQDLGIGGHDATQSNPDNWPELVQDAINGRAALVFDGEGDELEAPIDINPSVNPEITVFVVFNSFTGERVYRKLFGHDDGGFDRAVGLDDRSTANLVLFGGPSGRTRSIIDIVADQWYLLTVTYTPSEASAWVNGEQVVDAVSVNNGSGRDFTVIGNGGAGSSEWWGSIAEIRFYGAALTDAQRSGVEAELMETYGL